MHNKTTTFKETLKLKKKKLKKEIAKISNLNALKNVLEIWKLLALPDATA